MNDYNDPEQRKLNVYHRPSEIKDPNRYNTEFSELDDLNTENPLVIEALKDSYSFWIEEADVDGFRIDTAIYVEPEFLKGKQGIFESALNLGKEDFLVYGEAWLTSDPFSNNAEKEINEFLNPISEIYSNVYLNLIKITCLSYRKDIINYGMKIY